MTPDATLTPREVTKMVVTGNMSRFDRQAVAAVANDIGRRGDNLLDPALVRMSARAFTTGDTEPPVQFDVKLQESAQLGQNILYIGTNLGTRRQDYTLLPLATPETGEALADLEKAVADGTSRISSDDKFMINLWAAAVTDRESRAESGRMPAPEGTLYGMLQQAFGKVMSPTGPREVFTHKDYFTHLSRVIARSTAKDARNPLIRVDAKGLANKIKNLSKMYGLDLHESMAYSDSPWTEGVPAVDQYSDLFWQWMFRLAQHKTAEDAAANDQSGLAAMIATTAKPDGRRRASSPQGRLWLALHGILPGDEGYGFRDDAIATTIPGKESRHVIKAFNGIKRVVLAVRQAGMDEKRAALHFRISMDLRRTVPALPQIGNLTNMKSRILTDGHVLPFVSDHSVDNEGVVTSRIYMQQDKNTLKFTASTAASMGLTLGTLMPDDGYIIGQARQYPAVQFKSRMQADGTLLVEEALARFGMLDAPDALASIPDRNRRDWHMICRGFPAHAYLRLLDLARALSAKGVKLGPEVAKDNLYPYSQVGVGRAGLQSLARLLNDCRRAPADGTRTKLRHYNTTVHHVIGDGMGGHLLNSTHVNGKHSIARQGDVFNVFDEDGNLAAKVQEWLYAYSGIDGIELAPPPATEYTQPNRISMGEAQEMAEDAGHPPLTEETAPPQIRFKGIPCDIGIMWSETTGWSVRIVPFMPGTLMKEKRLGIMGVSASEATALGNMRTVIKQFRQYGSFNKATLVLAMDHMPKGAQEMFKDITFDNS